MKTLPQPIQNLVDEFGKLPGIGERSSKKITFHLMKLEKEDIIRFSNTLLGILDGVNLCEECYNFTTSNICEICSDDTRDRNTICVLEKPSDVDVIEKTGEYKGVYHILHGSISNMEGITPSDLKIKELLARIIQHKKTLKEVIIGTNANQGGNLTAMYINTLLSVHKVKVTRLAQGISMGTELDYADEITIMRSLENRKPL